MQIPLQITWKDFTPTPAVEEDIKRYAKKLDEVHDRITSCRVVVETPHRHHRHGKHYHVGIDLTVPGHEIVVNRDIAQNPAHEDLHVAIRDSFNAARRQLLDLADKRKQHRR
jgi:ribosome-associated translation inhibitor RaiA